MHHSDSEKLYTIGEVSKICNISRKALRHYDQMGVLSPDVVSKETGYRYYSEATLLLVPVVKYYKQMGFKLEEMQDLVEGNTYYYYIEQNFYSKIEELRIREAEVRNSLIAVSDWYDLLEEARMVRQIGKQDVSIKYITRALYCWLEQEFNYDYIASIINIEWVNYLESVGNKITGAVILKYPSYKEKMEGISNSATIMQRPVLPCTSETNTVKTENMLAISLYHVGPMETLDQEYDKIELWAKEKGYKCAEECYERYVVDYWTTRNPEEFVTEIIVPLLK